MSVRRRGDKWTVRYRDGAVHRSRTFTRKADADRFDREQHRRRELGTLGTLAVRPATLDEYVQATWAPTHGVLLGARTREVYAWAYDRHVAPASAACSCTRSPRRSSPPGKPASSAQASATRRSSRPAPSCRRS